MTFRPTQALVRVALLAAGATTLGLLTAQPALIVIAAPFLVWSALGIVRRPRTDEPAPTVSVSAHRLAGGQAVELAADTAAPERRVELSMGLIADAEYAPRWGAVCATGEPARLRARPTRWGQVELPAPFVTVSDAWGLWTATTRVRGETVAVSVAPDVPGRGDTLPHPTGIAGLHLSSRRGDGTALADIRPFQPGDRMRRVNWRVSSRTGELHTNATYAERDTDVVIVVDTLADLTTAELSDVQPRQSSLDTTVAAAASLVEHYLRLGDRVGLHDLGSVIGSIPPRTGIRQFSLVAERLARSIAAPSPWERVRPVPRLRPGSFVVVCSALLDRGVLDEIVRLTHRGVAVVVVDTLPERLGELRPQRRRGRAGHSSWWEEAWALRRLEREVDVRRLRSLGIPLTPWRGVEGLAVLAASLASGRSGVRLSRSSLSGGRA